MKKYRFQGELRILIEKAVSGRAPDIDEIIGQLSPEATFATTRYVDYALSLVSNEEGISRLSYYLFNGSLIQRNYCSLFFNRRGDWKIVREAYERGLIDEIQAFAR